MRKYTKKCSLGFIGLVVALGSASQATAEEPMECDEYLYGVEVSDVPREGEWAGVEGDEGLFALYFHGDWNLDYPAEGFEFGSDGEVGLSADDAEERLRQRQFHLYWADDEVGVGSWSVEGMEGASAIEVMERPEASLVVEGTASAEVSEWILGRESERSRPVQGERALQVFASVPQEWLEWAPWLESDTLFAVRFEVDEEPEKTPLRDDDRVRASEDGMITVYDGRMSQCWRGITVDWYEGDSLHGLIWPVGADPEEVSMRVEVPLEEHRQAVEEFDWPGGDGSNGGDENGDGDGDGDGEDEDVDADESASGSCQVAPLNGGDKALMALLFLAFLMGRSSLVGKFATTAHE